MTKAVDDLLAEGDAQHSTNAAIRVASVMSDQNVVLHGMPTRPIDVAPLVSTDALRREAALRELKQEFSAQYKDLERLHKAMDAQADRGKDAIKQDSSAAVTAWDMQDSLARFVARHWLLIAVLGFVLFYAGRAVLAVWNPVLSMGLNKVGGLGVSGLRTLTQEVIQGGENFKTSLEKHLKDNPQELERIKELFRVSHERAQSKNNQIAIRKLTQKDS